MQRHLNFQLGGPEKLVGAHDPRHALQENGGLAYQWYLFHPLLVLPFLPAFDAANVSIGSERNPEKTEVVYYVADLDTALLDWKINDVRQLASVSTAVHGNVTLGVAV